MKLDVLIEEHQNLLGRIECLFLKPISSRRCHCSVVVAFLVMLSLSPSIERIAYASLKQNLKACGTTQTMEGGSLVPISSVVNHVSLVARHKMIFVHWFLWIEFACRIFLVKLGIYTSNWHIVTCFCMNQLCQLVRMVICKYFWRVG